MTTHQDRNSLSAFCFPLHSFYLFFPPIALTECHPNLSLALSRSFAQPLSCDCLPPASPSCQPAAKTLLRFILLAASISMETSRNHGNYLNRASRKRCGCTRSTSSLLRSHLHMCCMFSVTTGWPYYPELGQTTGIVCKRSKTRINGVPKTLVSNSRKHLTRITLVKEKRVSTKTSPFFYKGCTDI